MKPGLQKPGLLLACVLCAALGWSVALPQARAGKASSTTGDAVTATGTEFTPDPDGVAGPRRPHGAVVSTASVTMPLSQEALRRRLLAGVPTAQLWEWLRSDTEPQHSLLLSDGQPSGEPLLDELVDRLGWQAWQQLFSRDTDWYNRNRCEYVLTLLAQKDPLQAYEVWKASHDFYGPLWAPGIPVLMLRTVEQTSAAGLVEVVKIMRGLNIPYPGGDLRFGPDFDFRAAADALAAPEGTLPDQRFHLLDHWAVRAPLEAAQWLADHPQAMKPDKRTADLYADDLVLTVAGTAADTPGRQQALEILGRLPEDFLKKSWESSRWGPSPVYSPAMAAAADAMGQEKNYLTLLIYQTFDASEIDPSWRLLPPPDREDLLDQAELHMTPRNTLKPVELREREHWRQAVMHAGERH